MLITRPADIPSSEITDQGTYLGRRRFIHAVGAAAHGIDCIGVTWGYGDAEELHAAGATAVVATVEDLLVVLRHG